MSASHTLTAELRHHAPVVVWRFALLMMVAGGFATVAEAMFYRFTPRSFWFEYHSVIPVEPVREGRTITFVSTATVHRTVDMHWNDVLTCDVGAGWQTWATQDTAAVDYRPVAGQVKSWHFARTAPAAGSVCKLRSVVTAELRYGARKRQTIDGPQFTVRR